MRWTDLSARNFGPLKSWNADTDSRMIVFRGRNEAGKSTVMEMLCTLLFGGQRRKNELKRLITWGQETSSMEGTAELTGGEKVTLRRGILPNSLEGTAESAGVVKDLGDKPYPDLEPLDRDLYRNIYALSLQDLLFPKKEAWNLLLDQLSADKNLRSASEVREDLYRSAMARWRPDRRARTEADDLADRLKEAYAALEEAESAAADAAQLDAEEARLSEEAALLKQEEEALAEKAEALAALREKAARRAEARAMLEDAGEVRLLRALPEDAAERLEALAAEQKDLSTRIAASGQRIAAMRQEQDEQELAAAAYLEEEDAIEALDERLPELKQAFRSLPETQKRSESVKNDLVRRAREHVSRELTLERLQSLSADGLRSAAAQARTAMAEQKKAEAAYDSAKKTAKTALPVLFTVFAGVLAVLGVLACPPVSILPGGWPVCLGALGLAVLLFGLSFPLKKARLSAKTAKERGDAEAAAVSAQNAVFALAGQYRNTAPITLNAEDEFIETSEALADGLDVLKKLNDENETMDRELKDDLAEVRRLSESLLSEPDDDPLRNIVLLSRGLSSARSWSQDAERREARLSEEAQLLNTLKLTRQQKAAEEREIRDILFDIPGETVEDKCRNAQEKLALHARGTALLSLPDLEGIPKEEELAANEQEIETRLRGSHEAREALLSKMGALKEKREAALSRKDAKSIQARIEDLTRKQNLLLRERDTDALLFGLLKVSEQKFRDEHQPDVVRRASAYLSQITAGRYNRIVMSEDQQGIRIYSPEAETFIDPQHTHLSQGTCEQVFLSLRLGLIDHLDPAGEKLPMLLDETFVNWDRERLIRGLSVLRQVAEERQIMFFTCHDWMVDALKEAGFDDLRIVSLEN